MRKVKQGLSTSQVPGRARDWRAFSLFLSSPAGTVAWMIAAILLVRLAGAGCQ